jgi:hypothetical protein
MIKGWVSMHCVSICAMVTCAFLIAGTHGSSADPLDEGGCKRLRTEQEALSVLGVDKFFDKGADWVKANLTEADLSLVKRYVNVFEQLKFRCPDTRVAAARQKVKAVPTGPVPPMPERSPRRAERAATPAKLAQPG